MGIEVRCGCGQLVTAEERYAGQHVQCPHCKSSVAVPVAAATAVPPPTPSPKDIKAEGAAVAGTAAAVLFVVWLCSDQLAPGLIRMVFIGGGLTLCGGLAAMFSGKPNDHVR